MRDFMIKEATEADYIALLDGNAPDGLNMPEGTFEDPDVLNMLRALANSIRPTFSPASWLIIDGTDIVGICSLVKCPHGDIVDIGYGICASRRRGGLASSAVALVLDWARSDPRVRSVRAETSIDNPASQRVLERNEFSEVGRRDDPEDGPVICWQVNLS